MALVCLPLLLLCSTVVVPPAAMVMPWAKPSLHESMEAEAQRRYIEMNGLTRPDNASSCAQASVVGNAIWRPRLVAPVTNAVVGPQMRELAGEPATGARSSSLGKRVTGDSSAGGGAVAKRAKTRSDAFKCLACGKVCQGAHGMSVHLGHSHTCDDSALGFEEYDPAAAHAASLREGAAEASCPWQPFKQTLQPSPLPPETLPLTALLCPTQMPLISRNISSIPTRHFSTRRWWSARVSKPTSKRIWCSR